MQKIRQTDKTNDYVTSRYLRTLKFTNKVRSTTFGHFSEQQSPGSQKLAKQNDSTHCVHIVYMTLQISSLCKQVWMEVAVYL